MTLLRVDVGFVSGDRTLVDFLARVFELDELPSITLGPGTVCRLQAPGSVVKVMLPAEAPKPPVVTYPFYALAGLRYLTLWVDDLDAVVQRAVAEGGRVERGPVQLVPGVRIAVLEDPEGNAIEVAQQESSDRGTQMGGVSADNPRPDA
jgi:predicted enzyme related to lactoylglutathione lyase